jgi:ectoine hydroxylase-related dioxygenase (phytanoyl-CoA dioxygenase family)
MLSPAERGFFDEHGWLVVRGAVAPARVAELAAALDAVVPEALYAGGAGGQVVEVAAISRGSPTLAAHATDSRLARLAAEALGVARLRLLQDTVFIKPPRDPARVEWHQDYTYFGFLDRPAALTARLALTPCTEESGCLRVVSGSHRWGPRGADRSFRATSVADALDALPAELRAEVAAREVLVELAPGDLSLHHCLTFHASAANRSARPRKTLAVRFVDAALRVDPSRLPSPEVAAYFPVDENGELAGDPFPVVWSA